MQAIKLLSKSQTQNKVIILLSDGYQNSGTFSPKDGVALAKKNGIKIYTIGVGKQSDYDVALLEQIAHKSGGEFFQAENAASMKDVYESIDRLEPSPIRSEHYLHKTALFDIPLFLAIVLLMSVLLKRYKAYQL
jgi:Ca-activated chloride channel family protein